MTEQSLFDQIPAVVAKAPNFGYFNTTRLSGPELADCKVKAISQTQAVLRFFQRHDTMNFSCWEVWKYMKLRNVPITSIRRAISCLADDNKLVETGNLRIGSYGRKCRCWKLK